MAEQEQEVLKKVTDIEAVEENVATAVAAFAERWMPLPELVMPFEVMDVGQLRDAMGLRASIDWGDPWPTAERLLLQMGFRWRQLGGCRVMVMREREDAYFDDGYDVAEEVEKS